MGEPKTNALDISVENAPAQNYKETAIAARGMNPFSAMAVVLPILLFYFVSIKLHYSGEFIFNNQPMPRSN